MTDLAIQAQGVAEPVPVVCLRVPEFGMINVDADLILRDGCIDIPPSIVDRGFFTLRPRPDGLRLQADRFIGTIPLNDRLTLEVTPRVPLVGLSRLLQISGYVPTSVGQSFRRYATDATMFPSLVDFYAQALSDCIREIAQQGLYREYVRREEVTSFPRGRILMGRTAKSVASRGVTHKLAVSWSERTSDNPVNRCLKHAVWLLVQLRWREGRAVTAGSRDVSRRLNEAYRVLTDVRLEPGKEFLGDAIVSGHRPLPLLRSYYQSALELALALISGKGISLEPEGDEVWLPSFVVDMSAVFERYTRNVLVSRSLADQWPVRILDGNKSPPAGGAKRLLEGEVAIQATPDIVVIGGPDSSPGCHLVIDAKYKPASSQPDRNDLNQVIAYGASYNARSVMIVQPQASSTTPPEGLRRLGTISDIDVYQYVMDLATLDPERLEAQFGQSVHGLCNS